MTMLLPERLEDLERRFERLERAFEVRWQEDTERKTEMLGKLSGLHVSFGRLWSMMMEAKKRHAAPSGREWWEEAALLGLVSFLGALFALFISYLSGK